MKKKSDNLRLIGLIATGLGFAVTLLSNWVSEKNMEVTIEEKVLKALNDMSTEE